MEPLPVCSDRWCENKARYTEPSYVDHDTGLPGPDAPYCGTHVKWVRRSNDLTRARLERAKRLDLAEHLAADLRDALNRGARIDVNPDYLSRGGSALVTLTIDDARKIIEWLS